MNIEIKMAKTQQNRYLLSIEVNFAFYRDQGKLNTKFCNNIYSTIATIQNKIFVFYIITHREI